MMELKSVGIMMPNMMGKIKTVPNHQPVNVDKLFLMDRKAG
jgi:hypothetical protein